MAADRAAAGGDVPMDFLFGSDLLVPADADFLAAVHGDAGPGAVEQHADKSLLAWLAQQSRVDGKIDGEKAVDVLAGFRADLLARAQAKTGGEPKAHQREFADIALVGLAALAHHQGDTDWAADLILHAPGPRTIAQCTLGRAVADEIGVLDRYIRAQQAAWAHTSRDTTDYLKQTLTLWDAQQSSGSIMG